MPEWLDWILSALLQLGIWTVAFVALIVVLLLICNLLGFGKFMDGGYWR